MNRAYSVLQTKSIDDEQRVIEGWATTPAADRVGDVVVPEGVTSAAEIPLFLHHDSTKVVGRVRLGKASEKGVPFTARLPKIDEPGTLRDRVDEAWGMVKHGLITAVSIGFRPLDGAVESLKGGGLKFLKSEVLELSLVPVPANSQALVTAFKSIDQQQSAPASGPAADQATAPGVSGQTKSAPIGPVSLISRRKDVK